VKKRKIRAITAFKVIQGHRGRYQSKARMRLLLVITVLVTDILSRTVLEFSQLIVQVSLQRGHFDSKFQVRYKGSTERCKPSYMLLKKSLLYVRKQNPHNPLMLRTINIKWPISGYRNWVRSYASKTSHLLLVFCNNVNLRISDLFTFIFFVLPIFLQICTGHFETISFCG